MGKVNHYFTENIVANFLILVIPSLPGIIAFVIANELIGDALLSAWLAPLIGVAALLAFFPLSEKFVNKIRAWARG